MGKIFRFFKRDRYQKKTNNLDELLVEAGELIERRRMASQSLTKEDREFILTVRKLAAFNGLSDKSVAFFLTEGQKRVKK